VRERLAANFSAWIEPIEECLEAAALRMRTGQRIAPGRAAAEVSFVARWRRKARC
jgi:hypothetical protein